MPDKATRVHHFHENTLKALRDLLCAAGLEHPDQLGPEHILRRVSPIEVRSLGGVVSVPRPGELLARVPEHAVFQAVLGGGAQRFVRAAGESPSNA